MGVTINRDDADGLRRTLRESPWRSTRVVVGDDGRMLYGIGHPIPEDEARRQGLIQDEPKKRTPAENKKRTPQTTKAPAKRAAAKPKEQ